MKIMLSCMISVALTVFNSCGGGRIKASEKEAENMLIEFYTKHFQIWEETTITQESPVNVLFKRLDSLMQKYCTPELRIEATEAFENSGVDILTYDLIGTLNRGLKVEKNTEKENCYTIIFIARHIRAPGGPIEKQVVLHVTVVKLEGNYKIASVDPP